jgi:hypothetical protein
VLGESFGTHLDSMSMWIKFIFFFYVKHGGECNNKQAGSWAGNVKARAEHDSGLQVNDLIDLFWICL